VRLRDTIPTALLPAITCLAALLLAGLTPALFAGWPAEQFQVQTREPVTTEKADIQREIEAGTGTFESLWDSVAGPEGSEWQSVAGEAEGWMNEIGDIYRRGGHRAPYIEPIVSDNGVPKYRVYIFPYTGSRTRSNYTYAGGGYQLSDCAGLSQINWVSYNADMIPPGLALPKDKYSTFAHETFHALEYGDQLMANCMGGNLWITEGMAEGASLYFTNRKWPNYSGRLDGSYSATGLRHYDWPLIFTTGRLSVESRSIEGRTGYLTGSFWYFLAENFGGVKVFPHFLEKSLSRNPSRDELTRWLDDRLRTEPDIQAGLYLAYPQFVSSFASFGGGRYTRFANRSLGYGESARTVWLEEAFSKCQEITLTPGNSSQEIRVSVQKIAAICIRLKYEGFSGNVTSQVEVVNARLDMVDQLHLGWAWKFGPGGEKNCDKEHKSQKTLWPPCLIKAFTQTGPTAGTYARTWSEETIDFGASTSSAERILILSNVAEEPWKTKDISDFRLKAGLTHSTLNGQPAEPTDQMPILRKTKLPKSVSEIGKEELYGLQTEPPDRRDLLTAVGLQPYVPRRSQGARPGISGGYAVSITELAYGQTGEVKGAVVLQAQDSRNQGGMVSSLVCKDAADKPIGEVTKSDESAFQITVDTDVCQLGPATMAQCERSGCPVVEHISGEVNIAFGWRQFNSTAPVDIRTKGVQAYIDSMPDSLAEAMKHGAGTAIPDLSGWPGGEGEGPGGDSGSSSGTGSSLEPCACTCDELAATEAAGEEYKARMAAGQEPTMSEVSNFGRCVSQCQREYLICRMEESDREKEAEEKAREEARQAAEPCDCSCDALAGFDAQVRKFQDQFANGGAVPNDALGELVRCAEECQSEHLACRMQGLR
jgi:hypothetical protein